MVRVCFRGPDVALVAVTRPSAKGLYPPVGYAYPMAAALEASLILKSGRNIAQPGLRCGLQSSQTRRLSFC